ARRRRPSRRMPRRTYQSRRACIQCSCHVSASSGGTKNSISICSNSSVRKMKLPGVISLRNDLPTCAMPNGGGGRAELSTGLKAREEARAGSGGREARAAPREAQHGLEVEEDALRGLGAQEDALAAALDRPDRGLEHEVELARLGEVAVRGVARQLRRLAT